MVSGHALVPADVELSRAGSPPAGTADGYSSLYESDRQPLVAGELGIASSSAPDGSSHGGSKPKKIKNGVTFSSTVEYLGPDPDPKEGGGPAVETEEEHLRRVIASSIIGNTLEWQVHARRPAVRVCRACARMRIAALLCVHACPTRASCCLTHESGRRQATRDQAARMHAWALARCPKRRPRGLALARHGAAKTP